VLPYLERVIFERSSTSQAATPSRENYEFTAANRRGAATSGRAPTARFGAAPTSIPPSLTTGRERGSTTEESSDEEELFLLEESGSGKELAASHSEQASLERRVQEQAADDQQHILLLEPSAKILLTPCLDSSSAENSGGSSTLVSEYISTIDMPMRSGKRVRKV